MTEDGTPMRPAVAAAVELVAGGGTLPAPLAEAAMEELMDGAAPPAQVAALLAMLRLRGETAEEVAAFARVMRARAAQVDGVLGSVHPVSYTHLTLPTTPYV